MAPTAPGASPRPQDLGRRSLGLRYKLLLYFAAVIALPLVILGVLAPLVYSRGVERSFTANTGQMIGQVARSVEFYIKDVEKVLDFAAASPAVLDFFRGAPADASETLLAQVRRSRPELGGLLAASADDRLSSPTFERVSRDPLTRESWYLGALAVPDHIALLPRPVGRNVRILGDPSADDIVAVSKAVRDPASGRILGVVSADLELTAVRDLLSKAKVGSDGFLFIVDAEGEPILGPYNPVLYRVSPRWINLEPAGAVKRIDGVDYQILARRSDYTGWRTVGIFSRTEAFRESSFVRASALVIGALTLVLALFLSFLIASSVARPVVELESLMGKAEGGDLSARFLGDTNDEVGRLGRSFNAMIAEIRNLIDLVYQEQRDKREAELRILQEQIKPHFLYNTLETIRYMAKRQGNRDVEDMVAALTKLFRIGLSRGKETIPLRDELEHVRSYLYIQSSRYVDKFDYAIEADEDCLDLRVLRLVLQPLAENAIYHGVKEKRGHGSIRVGASISAGLLRLTVEDDGQGMGPERLAEIEAILEGRGPGAEGLAGYGIYNVHGRIRYSYGTDYGLRYTSAPGQGTKVEIFHPILRGGDEA